MPQQRVFMYGMSSVVSVSCNKTVLVLITMIVFIQQKQLIHFPLPCVNHVPSHTASVCLFRATMVSFYLSILSTNCDRPVFVENQSTHRVPDNIAAAIRYTC